MYFTFEHERFKASMAIANMGDWQGRHDTAVAFPRDWEKPIMALIGAWQDYAERHLRQYESPIGDDSFIGEHWEEIGKAIKGLLNGQTGRLDCGTLSHAIDEIMSTNGIDQND